MIIMFLKTGHTYRLADAVTLSAVNDKIAASTGKFFEVTLGPDPSMGTGTPVAGQEVKNLFVTPESVSHFVVV